MSIEKKSSNISQTEPFSNLQSIVSEPAASGYPDPYKNKSDSSNNAKSIDLTCSYKISKAIGLSSGTLSQIKTLKREYLNPEEYKKIQQFFQEHLLSNSTNHLEPLSNPFSGRLKIEEPLLQKITRGVDEIIGEAKNLKATVINHSSEKSVSNNNTKSTSLTTHSKINKAMGLDKALLYNIEKIRRKYLSPEEHEKIQQFFQEHLPSNSTNHLEPLDPSKLSNFIRGKFRIEESLLQKITRGVDEIIENETQSQATVINHSSEKSISNNNKKCIDLTNEENRHDQNSIVNHPQKKAKITPIGPQPSTFHQNAIPVYHQSFFLEKAVQSTNFDDFQQPPAPGLTTPVDDLFYNIPDDVLFLPEEPVQPSSTDRQAAIQESSLDDLFLFVPDTDDVFKLESTWDE